MQNFHWGNFDVLETLQLNCQNLTRQNLTRQNLTCQLFKNNTAFTDVW